MIPRFQVTSEEGNYVSTDVYAFVRLQSQGSMGSVVQLHTPLGVITVNGRRLSFEAGKSQFRV